jgi:hypothetical protein
MNHAPKEHFALDQITLNLGDGFYLSLMSWDNYGDSEKEIALVRQVRPQSLLGSFHYHSIPLSDWFPEISEGDDDAIDLSFRDNEAEIVGRAINKALIYINKEVK